MKAKIPSVKYIKSIVGNDSGRIGYIVAWALGVPTSILILIFLVRGH
jgi:hypothetical protein